MNSHRYWMLHVSGNGGGSSLIIGSLVFSAEPGGDQLATGGTPFASKIEYSYPVANAFDADESSYWRVSSSYSSSMGAEHIGYDFGPGVQVSIAEISITYPLSSADYPSAFSLLFSDDGMNWSFQRSWSGLEFTQGETKILDATPVPQNQIRNVVIKNKVRRVTASPSTSINNRVLGFGPLAAGIHHHTVPQSMTPHTGNYFIRGTTTSLGDPLARRVDLYDQRSGQLIQQTFSKADGEFLFDYIGPGPWSVVGVDPSLEQNSVIFAHVVPAPMA